jgi:hypothetical protein
MSSALEACSIKGPVRGPVVLQVHRTEKQQSSTAPFNESRLRDNPVKSVARTVTSRHSPVVGDQPRVDTTANKALGIAVPSPDGPDGQTETAGPRATAVPGPIKPVQVMAPAAAVPNNDSGKVSEWRPPTHQQTQREMGIQGTLTAHGQPAAASDTAQVRIAALSKIIPFITAAVSESLHQRAPLRIEDLYQAQGLDTVWTKVETAVFLEAVHQNMPMLGARLLCPRYTLKTILIQVGQLAQQRVRLDRVPIMHKQLFQSL